MALFVTIRIVMWTVLGISSVQLVFMGIEKLT